MCDCPIVELFAKAQKDREELEQKCKALMKQKEDLLQRLCETQKGTETRTSVWIREN